LDLICQFKVTNLRHSKLLLKILVTHNMKNVISLKVRILGSNLFLTREHVNKVTVQVLQKSTEQILEIMTSIEFIIYKVLNSLR
jgi:hypothetical protein